MLLERVFMTHNVDFYDSQCRYHHLGMKPVYPEWKSILAS